MSEQTELLQEVKRLCILNFLELQDLKRRLKIAEEGPEELYVYANGVRSYVESLDAKMRNLVKEFPHLYSSK